MLGSLALLMAETTEGAKQMFAGLPAADVVNKTGNYLQVGAVCDILRAFVMPLQLAGRVMIVFMFLTTLAFDGPIRIVFDIIGLGARVTEHNACTDAAQCWLRSLPSGSRPRLPRSHSSFCCCCRTLSTMRSGPLRLAPCTTGT